MNRIDRLTAILIHLQTKRVIRAQELADRFSISLRTVYRDIRSLEEAGVPIGAEAGVGYFLEGYHLPPVMFTNAEASALLFGAKLIERWADASVNSEFESALYKIKSVLKRTDQEHLDDLDAYVNVHKPRNAPDYSDGLLTEIQQAIVRQHVLQFTYHSAYSEETTRREVEPLGLFHYGQAWHLIAFCRIRSDYRDFRVDRIKDIANTGQRFSRQDRLSLQEYLKQHNAMNRSLELTPITVLFQKQTLRFIRESKYIWGFVSEQNLGDYVRVNFRTAHIDGFCRWLFCYGNTVIIEEPDSVKELIQNLVSELQEHYIPLEKSY